MKNAPVIHRRTLTIGFLWMLTYLISLLILRKLHPDHFLGVVLTAVPILTFAWFVYRYIASMAAMDELRRRIQFEAVVIGFSLSLVVVMALSMTSHVFQIDYAYWGYQNLLLYFIIFYYIGFIYTRRKYTSHENDDESSPG